LNTRIGIRHLEVNCSRLIDEQFEIFRSILRGRFDLERMNLNGLRKRERHYQLLVLVALKISAVRVQTLGERVIIRFVQTLALLFHYETGQVHLQNNSPLSRHQ